MTPNSISTYASNSGLTFAAPASENGWRRYLFQANRTQIRGSLQSTTADNSLSMKRRTKRLAVAMNPDNWVDTHGDPLYRYALSRVRNPTVAEDLVQETFLAAIQGQASYQGNSSEFTWLTGILRHKTLDYFRKTSRAKEQSLDPLDAEEGNNPFNAKGAWDSPPSAWSSPHKALEQDEFWVEMQGCIATLPESMRRGFMMREFDGLESEEVASILDITTNNLWVMLSRARLKLRTCLQNHWFTGGA